MSFKRGDRINYIGGKFKPVNGTYIWGETTTSLFKQYVIEHPDGFPKEYFMKDFLNGDSKKGIDGIDPKQLKYGLKYIFVYENEIILNK